MDLWHPVTNGDLLWAFFFANLALDTAAGPRFLSEENFIEVGGTFGVIVDDAVIVHFEVFGNIYVVGTGHAVVTGGTGDRGFSKVGFSYVV